MKHLFIAVTIAATLIANGDEPKKRQQYTRDPEKIAAAQMKAFGGFIPDRREQKGKIVVINTQTMVSEDILKLSVDSFTKEVRVDATIEGGAFDIENPTLKGEATLFIIDNEKLPMSLVAPEAKWAMVNVSKLKSEQEAFFNARIKKEIFRALVYLCGGGASKYPQCITGCVTKVEDLDYLAKINLPLEFSARFEKYLPGYGITPYKLVPYRRACQEGWAPAPTNEFQKAVWDKVHASPSEPIKIKFDPKTDKE